MNRTRDGKFPAQYVYPTSGARLRKVITRTQLVVEIQGGFYEVSGHPRDVEIETRQ